MSDRRQDQPTDTPLNPALKSEIETVYDTKNPSPAPIETTSAHEGDGAGWPWIWLIVTAVCVVLAVYFLI